MGFSLPELLGKPPTTIYTAFLHGILIAAASLESPGNHLHRNFTWGGDWIFEVCAPRPEVAPEASFHRATGHFLLRIVQELFLGVGIPQQQFWLDFYMGF